MAVFPFALLRSGHNPGLPLLALLGTLIFLGTGCHKETQEARPAPPVPYVTPAQKTLPMNIHAIGKAQSTLNVQIIARTEGYLTEVLFKDGTDVKQGQKLFVIEYITNLANYDESVAAVDRAKADLGLDKLNYQRYKKLFEQGAVSAEEYDRYTLTYERAQADLDEALNRKIEAAQRLSYNTVNAPFSGRIGRSLYDIGNLVGTTETSTLTTLVTLDPMYIYFYPPASFLPVILRQQEKWGTLSIVFRLTDREQTEFRGEIDFINNQVIVGSDTIEMRAVVKNPDKILLPGNFGHLELKIGEFKDALTVPQALVQSDIEGSYVYLIDSSNELKKQYLTLGPDFETEYIVLKGLTLKDRILSGHLMILREGMKVKPIPPKQKSPNKPGQSKMPITGDNSSWKTPTPTPGLSRRGLKG